jgi:transposase-like protein
MNIDSIKKTYNISGKPSAIALSNPDALEKFKAKVVQKVNIGATIGAVAELYCLPKATVGEYMREYKDGLIAVESEPKVEPDASDHGNRYSTEVRADALRRIIENGEPIVSVAKALKTTRPTLYRWMKLEKDGKTCLLQ